MSTALRLIARTEFVIIPWQSSAPDARGINVDVFGPPVTYNGHVQIINQNRYQALGLDFQKSYIRIYSDDAAVSDVERSRGSDKIVWNGDTYKVDSITDWQVVDGWLRATCVKVQP
ncbi:phage collar protein [Limnohabitans sp.]|uniref:phage collar protein n=1 Tax=Limnohabitans sp. TaxID=1907725 RepID=UPI00286F5D46|nr:hypothetical protein [Limnohabitans sp.]